MRDQPSLNKNINQHHCTYATGPSKKIFVKGTVNGTVQCTFFFVMRLNITIVTSFDSLIVALVP